MVVFRGSDIVYTNTQVTDPQKFCPTDQSLLTLVQQIFPPTLLNYNLLLLLLMIILVVVVVVVVVTDMVR